MERLTGPRQCDILGHVPRLMGLDAFDQLKRREFITLLGGAAVAWPLAARAQQAAMPVVRFLDSRARCGTVWADSALGSRRPAFAEGKNVAVHYRWAENQPDRLPQLAAELVSRQVAVIAASGGPAVAFFARAATTTIPIVFGSAEDPVRLGLVASLARPGGKLNRELARKQLELLRELVPGLARIVALVNPANASITESTLREVDLANLMLTIRL